MGMWIQIILFFIGMLWFISERERRINLEKRIILILLYQKRRTGYDLAHIYLDGGPDSRFYKAIRELEQEKLVDASEEPNTPQDVFKVRGSQRRLYWLTTAGRVKTHDLLDS